MLLVLQQQLLKINIKLSNRVWKSFVFSQDVECLPQCHFSGLKEKIPETVAW